MQQSVFPSSALPCQIRHTYLQVLNTMTAVGVFPKYGRLCICDAQSSHKRLKIRLGCKLPQWDFRHTELTKVAVSDPVSLVYSTTEAW